MSSRYRVDRCIAKGGMGAVYVGVMRGAAGFERTVAIKKTHPHLLEDQATRELILREAQNAAAVRHPNVVSVDDVEEVDGELLLVMDFIEGSTLMKLLGRRTPAPIAARIILDAASGLSAIHAANLAHRDVSPQNVLIGVDGMARVTDFGIAKRISDPNMTGAMFRRGKLAYMAPEYLEKGFFGPAADLFALGAVLWELLSGDRLFARKSDIETARLTLAAHVPAILGISRELDRVVRTALAFRPGDRFATMDAFCLALESAVGTVATYEEVSAYLGTLDTPAPVTHTIEVEIPTAIVSLGVPSSAPISKPKATRMHTAFRLDERITRPR